MNNTKVKPAIRVVKKEERSRREQVVEATNDDAKKSTQQAAREMVATVTGWVSELQQRHRNETARAIKIMFPETTPQTN